MAQIEGRKLDSGDLFPRTDLKLMDGSTLLLPDTAKDHWTVLRVYRGLW